MNQFSKLELMTLEILKGILANNNTSSYNLNSIVLIDRAEDIAIALYNRFEENINGDEDV